MPVPFDTERVHNVPTSGFMLFSGADCNLFVNYVGSLMVQDLPLSIKGQRNISASINNLPYVSTADDRLTFGWGPDTLIRQKLVAEYGYEPLAIMAALSSTFHESWSAEVCHAYAKAVVTDAAMIPHLRQWRNHIKYITGVFAASEFAQLVEEYIRLDPFSVGPGSNLIARRCRVNPKAMAKGIAALSRVVSRDKKQVTLRGGAVIGWYAAFAEFFYDLRVSILSRTGDRLHGDPQNPATRVVLIYHEEPDLEVITEHWSTINEPTQPDDPYWTKHTHILPFGGRIKWHTLLPQVFGHAFWILDHEESTTLATLLGCIAKGLQGDYEHHMATKDHEIYTFYNTQVNELSYGIGLIQNLTGWLPELRKNQGRMERQLKRTSEEAAEIYNDSIAKLQTWCNCTICTVTNSESAPKNGYCLPTICETIVALGLAVSRMTVHPGIYPTREGVQGFYASQAEKRREAKHFDIKDMEARIKYYTIIYANEWKASASRRLQNAVELFSGSRPELDLSDSLVAVAHEGICAYIAGLKRGEGVAERKEERGLIEVTSGAVCLGHKVYTRVSTEAVDVGEGREGMAWEEVKFSHYSKPLFCK